MEIETGETLRGNTKTLKVRANSTKKQGNQLKNWFFTFNNYHIKQPEDILETIETTFRNICNKYAYQEEVGELNGTPHLQGAIELKKPMRWSEFGLPEQISWRKTRDEEKAINYCLKEETRKPGGRQWTYGLPKPLNCISVLRPWQQAAYDLMFTEPDNRSVYWYWEPNGMVGKSALVRYLAIKHSGKMAFTNGGSYNDIINFIYNTNMDICDVMIWDIPRCKGNHVAWDAVESIKNGMIMNCKYETGSKVFNAPHVFIFSNFPPDENWREALSEDRMKIIKI